MKRKDFQPFTVKDANPTDSNLKPCYNIKLSLTFYHCRNLYGATSDVILCNHISTKLGGSCFSIGINFQWAVLL